VTGCRTLGKRRRQRTTGMTTEAMAPEMKTGATTRMIGTMAVVIRTIIGTMPAIKATVETTAVTTEATIGTMTETIGTTIEAFTKTTRTIEATETAVTMMIGATGTTMARGETTGAKTETTLAMTRVTIRTMTRTSSMMRTETTTLVTTTEREGWEWIGSLYSPRREMTTLAHRALERFGLRGARLRQLNHVFVRVFHVVCSAREEYCLRMYELPANGEHVPGSGARIPVPPPGRPSLEQLRAQLMWLSALARETQLLVPELVPADYGSLMAYVPSEETEEAHHPGRQCVLLRWVPGTHKR